MNCVVLLLLLRTFHEWKRSEGNSLPLGRYMRLLPEAVQAKLPYRWFRQNATSLKVLDMVRATDGDIPVRASQLYSSLQVAGVLSLMNVVEATRRERSCLDS